MITPGLSHPPQFLFGVGFGSAFLYMSLTGYEKGLNVLSLQCTYEYLKRRASFKPSSKRNPLPVLQSCFSKTHFQFTCVLFILSGQTPSSGLLDIMAPNPGKHEVLMSSWKHQLSILTVYYGLLNLWSCAPLHFHLNFGRRHIFCLGVCYLSVLTSLSLEGWIC